jgi:type I restriction enzyme M protein
MADRIIDYISGIEITATPEETEATQVFSKILVEDYSYPKGDIQTRPQFRVKVRPSDTKKEYPVDIAVFSSSVHFDENLYIVVECKKKNRKDGKSQLEDYLRLSRASLGVWFNGNETLYLRKYESKGRVEFKEIPNIPLYGQRVEDIGLFERRDLQKTHNLKPILKNIRNYLAANNTGKTLDTEFVPQLINMIFCKIYDERFTKPDEMVSFRIGVSEDESKVNERIQALFLHVKEKYPDVFEDTDSISLSPNSIVYIVGELQQYCLIESERDVVSDAFETFILPSLRGGQGQFFTPRNVVKLLLSIVAPSTKDRIVDPACGSGGFLVEALRYVWHGIDVQGVELGWPDTEIHSEKQAAAIRNFRGIDKENFLSKTTKRIFRSEKRRNQLKIQ